ncbi:hypothetical protein BH23ACT7_BH23ACT7_04260 [soil metagenome]
MPAERGVCSGDTADRGAYSGRHRLAGALSRVDAEHTRPTSESRGPSQLVQDRVARATTAMRLASLIDKRWSSATTRPNDSRRPQPKATSGWRSASPSGRLRARRSTTRCSTSRPMVACGLSPQAHADGRRADRVGTRRWVDAARARHRHRPRRWAHLLGEPHAARPRRHVRAGIDIHLAPTWDNDDAWLSTLRHIAREGGVYVLGTNSCIHGSDVPRTINALAELYGGDDDWLSRGNAAIVAPAGRLGDRRPARGRNRHPVRIQSSGPRCRRLGHVSTSSATTHAPTCSGSWSMTSRRCRCGSRLAKLL